MYNPETKTIDAQVEMPDRNRDWADRIINNIIWGESEYNPNKDNATPPQL